MDTGPLGFKADVQVGRGSLWTERDKQAVTIIFHTEFAEVLAVGSEQVMFHIWSGH